MSQPQDSTRRRHQKARRTKKLAAWRERKAAEGAAKPAAAKPAAAKPAAVKPAAAKPAAAAKKA